MLNFLAENGPVSTGPAAVGRRRARFVSSDVFRSGAFGKNHPLAISRQSGVLDLCGILGWLPPARYQPCFAASPVDLARFHDAHYIHALMEADRDGSVSIETRDRYRIGTLENPVFRGLFERASTSVGGSIAAARLALENTVPFHPAGGTHHGRPDRASGFCYFNDPVFAILTLLDAGPGRVMYVDLDAHHGDGVQDAMQDDPRVLCVSIHEENRWPHTGSAEDRGKGFARNLPVPAGLNDSEMAFLVSEAVLPLMLRFNPEAVVITCGADGLAGDPLSKLELGNSALWHAVERLVAECPVAVVLGGGGYNPWTTVRCWTGLWGRLSGRKIPAALPHEASALLRSFSCELVDEEDIDDSWLYTLEDEPRTGPVRDRVKSLAREVLR